MHPQITAGLAQARQQELLSAAAEYRRSTTDAGRLSRVSFARSLPQVRRRRRAAATVIAGLPRSA